GVGVRDRSRLRRVRGGRAAAVRHPAAGARGRRSARPRAAPHPVLERRPHALAADRPTRHRPPLEAGGGRHLRVDRLAWRAAGALLRRSTPAAAWRLRPPRRPRSPPTALKALRLNYRPATARASSLQVSQTSDGMTPARMSRAKSLHPMQRPTTDSSVAATMIAPSTA